MMTVRLNKRQARIALFCTQNHFRRKVNAHTFRRLEGGKQIPPAASQFENALTGRNPKPVNFCKTFMVSRAPSPPRIRLAGNGIPVIYSCFLISAKIHVFLYHKLFKIGIYQFIPLLLKKFFACSSPDFAAVFRSFSARVLLPDFMYAIPRFL